MTRSGKSRSSKKTPPPSAAIRNHRLQLAAIVVAALIAHGLCLGTPFYMDDQAHLLNSHRISAAPEGLGVIARSWSPVHMFYATGQRFIPFLLWNTIYDIVGFSAPAFHALNLALHALTALLVFFTARELLEKHARLSTDTFSPTRIAFLAGLIFAVHPICTEVTHYAAQTSIALVTLFAMAASYCTLRWLRDYQWRWALGAAGSFLLATLSKEPGIFHVGLNGLLILLVIAPVRKVLKRAGKFTTIVIAGAVPVVAAVIYIAFPAQHFLKRILNTFTSSEFQGHLFTQSRIFWEYIQRILFPVNLCSDHLVARTISAADPIAWGAAAGLVLLLAAVLFAFWKGYRLVPLLGALALSHLLLRFIDISPEIMVEYRTYPSMPWFAMLGALGIAFLFRKPPARAVPASIIIVILLASLSIRRGLAWQSRESIVENITRQYPLHIRSHSYLQHTDLHASRYGAVLERQARIQENLNAVLAFNRSHAGRQYDSGQALAGFMLGEQLAGYALIELDRPEDAVLRMTEVIEKMRVFFIDDQSRAFGVLYRARGKAKAALGDKAGARADYDACLERKPEDTEVLQLMEKLGE